MAALILSGLFCQGGEDAGLSWLRWKPGWEFLVRIHDSWPTVALVSKSTPEMSTSLRGRTAYLFPLGWLFHPNQISFPSFHEPCLLHVGQKLNGALI